MPTPSPGFTPDFRHAAEFTPPLMSKPTISTPLTYADSAYEGAGMPSAFHASQPWMSRFFALLPLFLPAAATPYHAAVTRDIF